MTPDRRRSWLVAASLVALVAVGLGTWLLVRPGTYVAPTPSDPAVRADHAGAAAALEALEDAVGDRDRDAAAAVAPGSDRAAAELLAAVADNAAALRVEEFTARYVDAVEAPDSSGRWQAAVDLTWRFSGFDVSVAHQEVLVGFDLEDGAVGIVGFGGGDRRSPLWLSGPLEVRRSERVLVLAAGSDPEADLVAERAEVAVPVVEAVLPRWQGELVVEVPASEEGLAAALAAEPGSYADIAAVSASVDGTLTRSSQLHVFVNPELYRSLDPIGGQVVMSHEATHVATGAPLTAGVPLWLLEGFADYVALRDVGLPLSTTAGQIIQQVRESGPPDRLPGEAEFDQTATHLGAAYESAWIACLVLAEVGDEASLVGLYEDVSSGAEVDTALRARFGLTVESLTARWRTRLETLAAAAADGA